jgi:hypothetical protein
MKLIKEEIDRIKSLMGLIIEQKISLPILVKGSYSAPKGDADALHSFERRKSDGFGGKMLTKINEKLREVYKAGINPDVTDIKIDIDSTNYTVKWEATIDESKDGIAYMGVASRGSAGKTADRRAENQIDNLMRKLKRNDAEDIKLVLDFKNPSGVYIRQFFYKYSLPETNPSLSQSGDYLRTEKPTEIETTTDDIMLGGGSMEDVTPSTSGKYKSCEGSIFKKGCKDPNTAYKSPDTEGTIYKVQGCIGTIQDGYFGSKTEASLLEKTGKKEFDIDEVGNICKDYKPEDETVVIGGGGSSNFERITKTVIDKFEGGYWNPFCKHPSSGMGKSTETMFGLDRYNGNIESSSEGKEFFKIIDDEKYDAGAKSSGSGSNMKWSNMGNFCGEWKWLYRGGDKEGRLKDLAVKIMKRNFDRNISNFVKNPKTKEKIETIPGLTLHMSYATWNGPGFFKKFANSLDQGVSQGLSDKELIELVINDRSKTRLLNKDKVANAIRNPN